MKNLSGLRFFDFEVASIKKLFPHEKASLEADLDSTELEAISNFGKLKNKAHLYLGNKFKRNSEML